MVNIILAIHILIALLIIGLVLIQHGKGADMGASFGGGASKTVFGSRGAAPFLMKLTGFFALLFFVTSLSLGYLSKEQVVDANTLAGPSTTLSVPVNNAQNKAPEKVQQSSKINNSDNNKPSEASSPINQLKGQPESMGTNVSQKNEVTKTSNSSNSPLNQIKSQ